MASIKKVFLNTNPTKDEIKNINIGDIVYLNGSIYTAREGIYKKVLEEHADLPLELPKESATNFHCSPAAVQNENGDFNLGAVTATASFRFSRWIGDWLKISGAKLIIGKGGMSIKDYKQNFVPCGAIYLTTVGYGTGALLGRGVKKVRNLYWKKELGLAQAMWRTTDTDPQSRPTFISTCAGLRRASRLRRSTVHSSKSPVWVNLPVGPNIY